jgi:small subunit ribosomal protein S16
VTNTRRWTTKKYSVDIGSGGKVLLAIQLMRTGAKKRPSYRVVVKEKQSKRDGAYLENLGTYNPTQQPAEIKLKMDRVLYWLSKGAQPTDTVDRLIKASDKQQAPAQPEA